MINNLGLQAFDTFTNFVLVKVNKKDSKKKIIQGLLKNGIIVRELNNYGLKEHFRVSIGTDSEIK